MTIKKIINCLDVKALSWNHQIMKNQSIIGIGLLLGIGMIAFASPPPARASVGSEPVMAMTMSCGDSLVSSASSRLDDFVRSSGYDSSEMALLISKLESYSADYADECGGTVEFIDCSTGSWEITCNGEVKSCGLSCTCDGPISCTFLDLLPNCDPDPNWGNECSWTADCHC